MPGRLRGKSTRRRSAIRSRSRDAVAKYLEDAKARGLKDTSLTTFREVLERRLVEFCEDQGYWKLTQLDGELTAQSFSHIGKEAS